MRQPKLFEDDIPRKKDTRRGLWLDPRECPHLEWEKTETTYPNRIIVNRDGTHRVIDGPDTRMTWTCCNCGKVRGRA